MRLALAVMALICAVASFSAGSCTSGSTIPSFARPMRGDGFTEVASGRTSEKESHEFWLFAGAVPFSEWRAGAVSTFDSHGWTHYPDAASDDSHYELLARSAESSLCIDYYDLRTKNSSTTPLRRMVEQVAPNALAGVDNSATLLFVAAGRCA